MKYIIINGIIVLKDRTLKNYILAVKNNKIIDILETSSFKHSSYKNFEIIDAEGDFITPGLIEMHIHGCGPYDFASMPAEDYFKAEKFLQKKGINTFIPTFQYNPEYLDGLHSVLYKHTNLKRSIPGYYLEGPFINKHKRGGILEKNISAADIPLLEDIIEQSKGLLKIMTIAPEIKNVEKIIQYLITKNILPAAGHSNCNINDLNNLQKYTSHLNITHLFNAMSGISHKEPGLAMYPFLNKEVFFELNGDSIHLSDEIIKMSYDHLNHDKLILISDAVISAGGDYGDWEYCGQGVKSSSNGVRYKDSGTLIGSNKLLPDIIANFIRVTGASVHEAVKFATLNPAKALGLDCSLGSIEIGKTSDLIIFDKEFKVKRNLKGY